MATTTNFGWETPDDTDLVKDGAAAIRTALGGVDTSFVDLKGGTTGQVLSKASNTDLDFSWIAVDPLTILDAKGDLISATAADTPARLPVGTNGQILTADSTTSTGLKWASPAGGGKVLQVVMGTTTTSVTNTTASYVDSNLSASITPSSSSSKVLVLVSQNFMARRLQEENGVSVRLMRGATSIMENTQWMEYRTGTQNSNTSEFNQTGPMIYLDSPATTSSTTYKTQFYSLMDSNTASAAANQSSQIATMILLEIGA